MKIALTADLHLTAREEHPERYHALEDILNQLINENIGYLIIAGDLFDVSLNNYKDFELVCNQEQYKNIKIYIIPGNHDADLNDKSIVADNVKIFNEPKVIQINKSESYFLFLPYTPAKTMGEYIENSAQNLPTHGWILVAHGDWSDKIKEPNPYEPGIYMPLTSKDIQHYQPSRVFLGHIHKAMNKDRIHYMGSPCGLDITETGIRTYLVYDVAKDEWETRLVNTDTIFFNETIVVLPVENQDVHLEQEIQRRILSWNIPETDRHKVRLRVKVKGYSHDRQMLYNTLEEAFRDYNFYKDEKPDISEVAISEDLDLGYIVEKVKSRVENLNFSLSPYDPSSEDILLAAVKVIYGE